MNALLIMLLAGAASAGPMTGGPLQGTVQETLDAGTYTYVRIATAGGDRWAAIVKTALKTGQKITVAQDTVMENFASKTLGRTFDRVVFGFIEGGAAGNPHAKAGVKTAAQSQDSGKPVEKAAGPDGRTIAEVFAQKASLKGKTVAVRGRVVKYNAAIMGVNWLHLRDGSGSPSGKNNDITVTTEDTAALGQIVTVRGPVTLDKDLGAGYNFPVLLEKARLIQ